MTTRTETEAKIQNIIQQCCKNKPTEICPLKWGLTAFNRVDLMYWNSFSDNKKVIRLLEKIRTKIEKELGLEVWAYASTTNKLNWHYLENNELTQLL